MAKKQSKAKGAGKRAKATAAPKAPMAPREGVRDPRLPAAGTVIVRPFKGKDHRVTVLDAGFRYEGKEYRSLTALALQITGYPACSGPAFFKLTGVKGAEPTAPVAKAPKGKRAGKKASADATPEAAAEVAPAAETATA